MEKTAGPGAPGVDRPEDVLQASGPDVLEDDVELSQNLLIDVIRNANATGFGNPFQTGCNVHTVAQDVVVLDQHVPEIDPNTEPHAPVFRQVRVALGHRGLHRHRAFNRRHD